MKICFHIHLEPAGFELHCPLADGSWMRHQSESGARRQRNSPVGAQSPLQKHPPQASGPFPISQSSHFRRSLNHWFCSFQLFPNTPADPNQKVPTSPLKCNCQWCNSPFCSFAFFFPPATASGGEGGTGDHLSAILTERCVTFHWCPSKFLNGQCQLRTECIFPVSASDLLLKLWRTWAWTRTRATASFHKVLPRFLAHPKKHLIIRRLSPSRPSSSHYRQLSSSIVKYCQVSSSIVIKCFQILSSIVCIVKYGW